MLDTAKLFVDQLLYLIIALTFGLIVYKLCTVWVCRKNYFTGKEVTETELDYKLLQLSVGLSGLATIASAAPFIGLGGTVLHIISALTALNGSAGDVKVIAGPIANSLYATLYGLVSAIPATLVYNLTLAKLNRDYQLACLKLKTE